jgi:hypothetical protein
MRGTKAAQNRVRRRSVVQEDTAIKARQRWWMWVVPLAGICVLGLWLAPQASSEGPTFAPTEAAYAVGTSGQQPSAPARDVLTVADDLDPQPSLIREIETITGANDAMALTGRRVDLHVDVQERATDVAFWVGPRDNRVLVVLVRPRDRRQRGETAGHSITPVHGGQRAAISGVIRPVPAAEEMVSWNLSDEDKAELDDRKVYIRADAVTSEGHGHF